MDGASKFVKGDAIAAIIIVVINLVGGFVIGVLQKHLSFGDAIKTYSLLTVGDGLVAQIPALLISLSSGLIVTRAATESDLGTDLLQQFTRHKRTLQLGGGDVPRCDRARPAEDPVPVRRRHPPGARGAPPERRRDRGPRRGRAGAAGRSGAAVARRARATRQRHARRTLELEIAYDLIDLVDPSKGGDLLDRVKSLRRKLALELGVVIPLVRTRDNLELPANTYAVRVHGVEVGRGEAPPGHVLVLGDDSAALPGIKTREPVFGLPARWVPLEFRHQAEVTGATVVDRGSVITTHLAEVVRRNAGRLLGRQDVKMLIDVVKQSDPVVVDELNGANVTTGEIQRVLQMLLDEGVGIRDLVRIFEVVSERARVTKDTEQIVEAVRTSLGPAISAAHAGRKAACDHPRPARGARARGDAARRRPRHVPRDRTERRGAVRARGCARGGSRRNEGHRTGARVRHAAATVVATAAARGRAPFAGARLHGARTAARARDDRSGEPWPASCGLRVRSSKSSSTASGKRSAPTRTSSRPTAFGRAASAASSRVRASKLSSTSTRSSRGAGPRRGRASVPTSLLDIAEEVNVNEAEQTIDLAEPLRVSTETHDFGTMLAKLTRELDEQEADMPPRPSAPQVTFPEDETPVAPRAHYRRHRRAARRPVGARFGGGVRRDLGADARPGTSDACTRAPPAAPMAPAMFPAPVPTRSPAAPMMVPPDRMPGADPRLVALGLPPELVPSVAAAADVRTAIVQRLAQLPAPPMLPRATGVVVAVVGIGTAPVALARRLADELEVESDHIVLATPEAISELSHPDEAEAFRRSCRRRSEPTVVACSIGAGRAQLGWAHRMLDRLEPTVTWAVIEASCKSDDIAHRVKLLGGVDVLALTGIADTVSPAAVLSLGIPIGRIGATHATPAAWADLLVERLERTSEPYE